MGRIEQLIENYGRFVALPWPNNLAGSQKVWFAVYDKMDERRLRVRLCGVGLATKQAKHGWRVCDLTDTFAEWMATQEYKDSYFESPDDLEMTLPDFRDH